MAFSLLNQKQQQLCMPEKDEDIGKNPSPTSTLHRRGGWDKTAAVWFPTNPGLALLLHMCTRSRNAGSQHAVRMMLRWCPEDADTQQHNQLSLHTGGILSEVCHQLQEFGGNLASVQLQQYNTAVVEHKQHSRENETKAEGESFKNNKNISFKFYVCLPRSTIPNFKHVFKAHSMKLKNYI